MTGGRGGKKNDGRNRRGKKWREEEAGKKMTGGRGGEKNGGRKRREKKWREEQAGKKMAAKSGGNTHYFANYVIINKLPKKKSLFRHCEAVSLIAALSSG